MQYNVYNQNKVLLGQVMADNIVVAWEEARKKYEIGDIIVYDVKQEQVLPVTGEGVAIYGMFFRAPFDVELTTLGVVTPENPYPHKVIKIGEYPQYEEAKRVARDYTLSHNITAIKGFVSVGSIPDNTCLIMYYVDEKGKLRWSLE